MNRLQLPLDQLGRAGRFTKVLVQLKIFQYEVQAHSGLARRGIGFEAYRFIFHLRHPSRVFRSCLGQEVRLVAANVGVAAASGQGVDVKADEKIARLRAVAAPVSQSDQGISRAGHVHAHAPAFQLIAQEQSNLEGDILLLGAPGKEDPRVPGVHSSVAGIDGDQMPGAKSVGKSRLGGGRSPRYRWPVRGARYAEAGASTIVSKTAPRRRRQDLCNEL